MRFTHAPSGRRLRLGYCMNLHPADTLDGVISALERIALPIAGVLTSGEPFGVGMYIPLRLAARLADPAGKDDLARLDDFLCDNDLDPFTFNAFPAAGFARPGLKARVFEPTWMDDARVAYTRDVARVAAALAHDSNRHISISTHPGMHASAVSGDEDRRLCAQNLARACGELARLEAEGAPRIVLSVEAEPRASANDTEELARFLALVRDIGAPVLTGQGVPDPDGVLARHLGVCLDACHAAVEFEETTTAFANATRDGTPLGKLQFSSALALREPDTDALGRARLLSLDEPVYLHQVTGRSRGERLRVGDLGELASALERGDAAWNECSEWRCHFHVPVDIAGEIDRAESGGLATTRAFADVLLARVLADPDAWGTDELHVEIETYTWQVLPSEARRRGSILDGLLREYEHVAARLAAAGWTRAIRPQRPVDTKSGAQ